MFSVELNVVMSASDLPTPVMLVRSMKMPFVPYPGLTLYGLIDDLGQDLTIEQVAFDVIDGVFHCQVESDDDDFATLRDKVAEYGKGWRVKEQAFAEGTHPRAIA